MQNLAALLQPHAGLRDDAAGDWGGGAPNLGVTLDFAHVLYADEQPAFAAALIARHSRLLGAHLNDGYAGASRKPCGRRVGEQAALGELQAIAGLSFARKTVNFGTAAEIG